MYLALGLITRYFITKNLKIIGTDLETQWPERLSLRALNRKNC